MHGITRVLAILLLATTSFAPNTVSAAHSLTTKVTAWVSNKAPDQNTSITAFAQVKVDTIGQAGITTTFTWKFKSGDKTCTGKTDNRGIASCKLSSGLAPYKTKVTISAALTVSGQKYTASTTFTPTKPGSLSAAGPTPTPAAVIVASPTATTAAIAATATPLAPPAAANCSPSYPDVCLPPDQGDWDCAGGSGNGPNYIQGPIKVLPPDPFDLDRDGDGIGCDK